MTAVDGNGCGRTDCTGMAVKYCAVDIDSGVDAVKDGIDALKARCCCCWVDMVALIVVD